MASKMQSPLHRCPRQPRWRDAVCWIFDINRFKCFTHTLTNAPSTENYTVYAFLCSVLCSDTDCRPTSTQSNTLLNSIEQRNRAYIRCWMPPGAGVQIHCQLIKVNGEATLCMMAPNECRDTDDRIPFGRLRCRRLLPLSPPSVTYNIEMCHARRTHLRNDTTTWTARLSQRWLSDTKESCLVSDTHFWDIDTHTNIREQHLWPALVGLGRTFSWWRWWDTQIRQSNRVCSIKSHANEANGDA